MNGHTEKKHAVVVGAGVVGLTNAVHLLEAGFDVTVIGKHFPGSNAIEYTSPWAGAMWRTHAGPDDKLQQKWDMETYEHWMQVVDREQNLPVAERCGIVRLPALNCWDSLEHPEILATPTKTPDTIWFAKLVRDFKLVKDPSALPEGVKIGITYTSLSVDIPRYLEHLVDKVRSLGGKLVQQELPISKSSDAPDANIPRVLESIQETVSGNPPAVVVLCPGLGARTLLPDPEMYPIRGQTHLVKGVGKAEAIRQGVESDTGEAYVSYMVPRPESGVTLLGGCKEAGNWSEAVDQKLKEKILARARLIGPELLINDDFEMLESQIGLRPGRKGGVRIGQTKVGGVKVVFAYGHAGAGFQNSIGCAKEVIRQALYDAE